MNYKYVHIPLNIVVVTKHIKQLNSYKFYQYHKLYITYINITCNFHFTILRILLKRFKRVFNKYDFNFELIYYVMKYLRNKKKTSQICLSVTEKRNINMYLYKI